MPEWPITSGLSMLDEEEILRRLKSSASPWETWAGLSFRFVNALYVLWLISASILPGGVWLLCGLGFIPAVLLRLVCFRREKDGASWGQRSAFFWHRNFCLHVVAALALLDLTATAAFYLMPAAAVVDYAKESIIQRLSIEGLHKLRRVNAGLVVLVFAAIVTSLVAVIMLLPTQSAISDLALQLARTVNAAQRSVAYEAATLKRAGDLAGAVSYQIVAGFIFVAVMIFVFLVLHASQQLQTLPKSYKIPDDVRRALGAPPGSAWFRRHPTVQTFAGYFLFGIAAGPLPTWFEQASHKHDLSFTKFAAGTGLMMVFFALWWMWALYGRLITARVDLADVA